MGRIRTIKPEFWRNEALSELPEATHMLAAALLNYCDDEGYFNANPRLIMAECSPLREPSVSIQCSLTDLSRIGYIRLGEGSDGRAYGHIINFSEHQRVNRPTRSKIAEISIDWGDSVSDHGGLMEDSLPERKGKEQGREQGNARGRAPNPIITLQTILDPMTAKRFVDHVGEKGKRLSSHQAEAMVSVLQKWQGMGGDVQEAINAAILRGWVSFDIEWLKNAGLKFNPKAQPIDWPRWVEAFNLGGIWKDELGPKPGEPGCLVPAEFLGEI